MTSAVSGCVTSPTNSTVSDRLKAPAADHARALAGDDAEKMRETGLRLIALMQAAFAW